MKLKKLAMIVLSISLLQAAPKASAHGGGTIILLPVIIAFQLADLAAVNARTGIKGFWAIGARSYSENKLDLIHKKSNSIYSFARASTLERAKEACAHVQRDVNPARLATPEEVLKLYALKSVDRLNVFFTSEELKGHVLGFYDGEKDYFHLKVKNQKLTLIDRPITEEESPVVCVRDYNKEPDIFSRD